MEEITRIYKALSDETRLRIANILVDRNLCVNRIAEVLGIRQSKASRHLAYLKGVGLVNNKRRGAMVYYTLSNDDRCQPIIKCFKELRKNVKELGADAKKTFKRTCC